VGLDVGTRTVHVAEVASRGGPAITNFGGVALPDNAVREGEVMDPTAVAQAIRELVGAAKLKNKRVHLGVANQRVVVRQIELPWMPEDELRSSLPFQVQEFIPIPVEEAQLDYHVLEEVTNEDGARGLRLLLVAAHRDMISGLMEAVQQAGLKPVSIDLNPFAQLRTMSRDTALEQGPEVLVDVGAGVTDIVVHERSVPIFVRILVLGSDDITEALSSGLSIDREAAELIKQGGLHAADQSARSIMEEQTRKFVEEVRGSLDYYRTQVRTGGPVQRILVSGGGALLDGLADRLSNATNLPVQIANPFDRFQVKGTSFGPEELAQVGPALATAIGLALGGQE
jgi:type IV pilus assembly protein PilM